MVVMAISAFSAYSEINLLTEPGNPVRGRDSFANAFQDIFMLFVIAAFSGFYIGSDFSNRTIQAELSKGHRRLDIIFSKAFVFCISAGFIMLLYPVTVCLIHTIKFGWGDLFNMQEVLYLLRVSFLGIVLNIGTASIYVCFAFPILFSIIDSTIGKKIDLVGRLFEYSTLSQLKYIVNDNLSISTILIVFLSSCITIFISITLSGYFFSNTEIK